MTLIGFCKCETICERWGIFNDGSGGYFTPYAPNDINNENKCKKLTNFGKDIKPQIIKRW